LRETVTLSPQLSLRNTGSSYGYLAKFDPNGTPDSLTNRPFGQLAVDAQGNLFVVSSPVGGVWIRKYDPSGALLWERSYDTGKSGTLITGLQLAPTPDMRRSQFALALTTNGDVVVASEFASRVVDNEPADLVTVIRQLNPVGELIAKRQLRTSISGGLRLAGFSVASDGTIIAVGSFTGRLAIDDYSVTANDSSDIFLGRFYLPPYPPMITWNRTSTGLTLIWPTGFVLQSTTTLNPANWQDTSGSPPMTIPLSSTSQFFRLRGD
jgi:hypothetical protein